MTNNHIDIDLLNACLDSACTPAETLTVQEHLATCAECQATLDELTLVRAAYRSLGDADVPRSFALTREMATPLTPLVSPTSMPAPRRLEKIARIVAIAAVLAFLALGTARIAGWTENADTPTSTQTALESETNTSADASQEQEPALERGQVREQGDAAAIGANALAVDNALVDTPAQATSSGLTPLEITIIGVGATAIASSVCWGLLHSWAGEPSR